MTNALAATNGIHPAIADHYEGMNGALHERDNLRKQLIQSQNELTVARDMVDFLKNRLDIVTGERDRYMRYSFALTTRINSMQDIWAGMIDLSKQEADSHLPSLESKINDRHNRS